MGSINEPKEIYENTSFELNSVEKDSVFDQKTDTKVDEFLSNVENRQEGSQILDSESELVSNKIHADMELDTEQVIEKSDFNIEEKSEDIFKVETQNTNALENITTKLEEEQIEQAEVNDPAIQSENVAENGCDSNLHTGIQESELTKESENETITEIEPETNSQNEVKQCDFEEEVEKQNMETVLQQKSEDLNKETYNVASLEKPSIMESVSIEQTAVTELASENEKAVENGSEIDLQTGIQDSEPAIEIETTKKPMLRHT